MFRRGHSHSSATETGAGSPPPGPGSPPLERYGGLGRRRLSSIDKDTRLEIMAKVKSGELDVDEAYEVMKRASSSGGTGSSGSGSGSGVGGLRKLRSRFSRSRSGTTPPQVPHHSTDDLLDQSESHTLEWDVTDLATPEEGMAWLKQLGVIPEEAKYDDLTPEQQQQIKRLISDAHTPSSPTSLQLQVEAGAMARRILSGSANSDTPPRSTKERRERNLSLGNSPLRGPLDSPPPNLLSDSAAMRTPSPVVRSAGTLYQGSAAPPFTPSPEKHFSQQYRHKLDGVVKRLDVAWVEFEDGDMDMTKLQLMRQQALREETDEMRKLERARLQAELVSLRRENAALRDKVVPLTVLRHAITVEKELTATLQDILSERDVQLEQQRRALELKFDVMKRSNVFQPIQKPEMEKLLSYSAQLLDPRVHDLLQRKDEQIRNLSALPERAYMRRPSRNIRSHLQRLLDENNSAGSNANVKTDYHNTQLPWHRHPAARPQPGTITAAARAVDTQGLRQWRMTY